MTIIRRAPARLLAALLGAALLAGCGGGSGGSSNGIDKMSATDAIAKVKTAVADVKSVHVKGSVSQSGQSFTLDVSVGSDAATGSIGFGGGTMDVRLVDGVTYFRGDSKVFAAFGANAAVSSQAAGKWIKDTGSSGPAAGFATFLNRQQLFDQLLKPNGTVKKGGTTTVNGEKAVILIDEDSSSGGKLFIAATGKALPLRIEPNTGQGSIDFLDYDADVNVEAPSGAIDISQLSGG